MRGKSRFRQTKFMKSRNRNRHEIQAIINQRYKEIEEETSHEDCEEKINKKPLSELLRSWANCHGVTTRAVNDLLRILITSGIFNCLKSIHAPVRAYIFKPLLFSRFE